MNEMQERKQLTVQEALELTARNLEGIAGEVPMKMKGLIYDPMMAQVWNIRSCVDVLNMNAAKATEQEVQESATDGAQEVKFKVVPEGASDGALFPEGEPAPEEAPAEK